MKSATMVSQSEKPARSDSPNSIVFKKMATVAKEQFHQKTFLMQTSSATTAIFKFCIESNSLTSAYYSGLDHVDFSA